MSSKLENKLVGLIAGNFDVIHPGYVRMFRDIKENACDWLVVALHVDPSAERPSKMKPILTEAERTETLLALRFVDEVIPYNTEEELVLLLKKVGPSVRVLGSDYQGRSFTGDGLAIPIYYHSRDHEWSTTRFKNEIADQVFCERKGRENEAVERPVC